MSMERGVERHDAAWLLKPKSWLDGRRGLINKKAKCTLPALDTQLFLAKLINKNKIIN